MGTKNYGTFPVKSASLNHGFFCENFKATSKYKLKKKRQKETLARVLIMKNLLEEIKDIHDVMGN